MDTGDDALIRALQERAWHPGKRHDATWLPAAWLTERHGPDYPTVLAKVSAGHGVDGSLWLPWNSPEIDEYFADAPRGPLFAPASPTLVESAEAAFGYPLPELLRRVYLEVGDGGFGPGAGLLSLAENLRGPGWIRDQPSAVAMRRRDRELGLPSAWFQLGYGGCTLEWRVSLNAVDAPVLLYDGDSWVPEWGHTPHDGLHAAVPLREWLRRWVEGEELVDLTPSAEDEEAVPAIFAEITHWRDRPWAVVHVPIADGEALVARIGPDRVPSHHTREEHFHWRGRAYRGDFTGESGRDDVEAVGAFIGESYSLWLSAENAGDLGELLRWLLPDSGAVVATPTAGPEPAAAFLTRLDAGEAS